LSLEEPQREPTDEVAPPSPLRARLTGALRWSLGHWKQAAAAGVVLVALLVGIAVTWTLTAGLAIEGEREKLDQALAALDAGEYEQARSLVRHVLNSGVLPRSDHGAPLFVLGAVKTHDAGTDVVPERRRTEYLVASRYLNESRSYGFAPGREKQGLLLLGKSLVESYQTAEGINVLREALEVEPPTGGPLNVAVNRVLAETYTLLSKPDFDLALLHVTAVLDDEGLSTEQRVSVLLLKATILARLGRFDDAIQTLASQPAEAARQPLVLVTHGQILLDGAEAARQLLPVQELGALPAELKPRVEEAARLLSEAVATDRQATDVTRRALYLLGRCAELQGDRQQASQLFSRTFQQFGTSPEGLAAVLAEAELLRRADDYKAALVLYRRVLESETDPATYRSEVLSLTRLRERILEAVDDYVEQGLFASAILLVDRFPPLFSRAEQLALRGATLRRWGDWQLAQATDNNEQRRDELRQVGLQRLREAGVAFETLAKLRFATDQYTTDVWNGADSYYRGHSYSSAARLLDVYLQNEPEKLNAQALLRLGQANLALGRVDQSIESFEECIELYSRDNATYQARIDGAKAYWYRGDAEDAIRLLRVNLTESTLKPTSPEWKDSLFSLGLLKFEQDAYEDAISTLEEAVERYPNDRQSLQAQYLIGEAYRRWAQEPLERLQQARTESERGKSQQLVNDRLQHALDGFKSVQRAITLKAHGVKDDPVLGAMLRNCYMLEGAVLFDLERYEDAIKAYSNVSSLYPNEPFVLETFVQIAHCWQRLDRADKARGAVEQAQQVLERLSADSDFVATTAFNREEWRSMLNNMSQW
jgi:tetratricopeptide (TPR) repeat protein